MRIRLNMAYDGTPFRGWQIQPDAVTVQGALEEALSTFYGGRQIRSYASGRTDSGVHAVDQVVHYDAPVERDEGTIVRGLNALLPASVRVWRAKVVADDFHARFQARERIYGYRLLDREDIFHGRFAWWVPYAWEAGKAQEAADVVLGSHDFQAFSTRPEPDESTRCDIRRIEWERLEEGWLVRIAADRFLRRLVRTLIGTLVEIGAGRLEKVDVAAILDGGEGRVGVPAPAKGLALLRVKYDIDDEGDRPASSLWRACP